MLRGQRGESNPSELGESEQGFEELAALALSFQHAWYFHIWEDPGEHRKGEAFQVETMTWTKVRKRVCAKACVRFGFNSD